MSDRIALHTLAADACVLPLDGVVPAIDYSRFKYGDGVASIAFGRALADRFHSIVAPRDGERIFVTSSGYGAVPPAARSLVSPFVARMRRLAPGVELMPLRVHRLGVSPGDYATMDAAARELAVGAKSMHVDPRIDVAGARVIALDDIRVTGTHELAMDGCLNEAGASWIDHLYIVDAHSAAGRPSLESDLNGVAASSVEDLLVIVDSPRFVPNARLAKKITTLGRFDQERFLAAVPPTVVAWILDAVERDGLSHVPAYATGVRRLQLTAEALAKTTATA